jgi:hypothetical protein
MRTLNAEFVGVKFFVLTLGKVQILLSLDHKLLSEQIFYWAG